MPLSCTVDGLRRGRKSLRAVTIGCCAGLARPIPSEGMADTGQDAIVVGSDGSAESARAVRWAARSAAMRHARVHVVHAFAPLAGTREAGLPVLRRAYEELRAASREQLGAAIGLARDTAGEGVAVTGEMPEDPAAAVLVERSRQARMIVLGSSGTGGFTGMLTGSTAVTVSAHAACPVVVVRGREDDSGPVVTGVDGSAGGERALATAFDEASRRGAALIAVHAWSDDEFTGLYGIVPLAVDWAEIERDAQRLLAERVAGWCEKYPDVHLEQVVVRDRPRRTLLDWSARAQLVVVGSRGRGGFRGLLLGSTSQALVHHAGCPVMIVRSR